MGLEKDLETCIHALKREAIKTMAESILKSIEEMLDNHMSNEIILFRVMTILRRYQSL